MGYILYESGKPVGDLLDWNFYQAPAEYKTVLGKTFLTNKANTQCTFTSPKPINRKKGHYTVLLNQKTEYRLQIMKVVHGTGVTALVLEERFLK